RPRQPRTNSDAKRFGDSRHDDWDRFGCPLGRLGSRRSSGDNQIDRQANQVGREVWKPIGPAVRRAVFDLQVPPFDITALAKPAQQASQIGSVLRRRNRLQNTDAVDLRRLRARRERPSRCAATEKHYEAAPLHSITSSARARIEGGMVRPSALAVFRLITSWYLEA